MIQELALFIAGVILAIAAVIVSFMLIMVIAGVVNYFKKEL